MKNKIQILNNPSDLVGAWTIDAFNKAYNEESDIKGFAIATMAEDEDFNPDKMGIVTIRMIIENGKRAKEDQKYIVGIRFYSFGDMATIDIVSLDKGFHKDICLEHMERMNWPIVENGKLIDKVSQSFHSPFMFVGGHLDVKDNNQVNFSGSSGDYGNEILFSDANSIAAYAASVAGIELGIGDKEEGEKFVQKILQIMVDHKLKNNFYEQLVHEVSSGDNHKLGSQHIGSLMTMKSSDRAGAEGGDMIQIMVEEMSGGLGRSIMLEGVVKHIRKSEEQ